MLRLMFLCGLALLVHSVHGDVIDAVLKEIGKDLPAKINAPQMIYAWFDSAVLVSKECTYQCYGGSVGPINSLQKAQIRNAQSSFIRAFVKFPNLQFSFNSCSLKTMMSTKNEALSGMIGDNQVTLEVALASAGSGCKVTVKNFFIYGMYHISINENDSTKKLKSYKQFDSVSARLASHIRFNIDQAIQKIVGKTYTTSVPCQ